MMPKTASCRYCNSAALKVLLVLDEPFAIYKCNSCSLVQTLPETRAIYNENSVYLETYLANEKLFKSFFQPLVQFAHQFKAAGKMLDIGCSTGFIMDEALKLGYDTEGLELNKKAAEYCLSKGLKVHNDYLAACAFPDNTFDIVTMSHVLEHIPDLHDFLQELHRVIKKSGFLVLSQPLYDSLIAKVLKHKWYGWVPNEHIWHFTPGTIAALLEENGFKVVKTERNSMYYPLGFNAKTLATGIVARLAAKIGLGDQFYVAAQKQ